MGDINIKYYRAKKDLDKKLEALHEECKKQVSIKNKVNINTQEYDKSDGTHVKVEPLNLYLVDGEEEWITIKVTTTRTTDGSRRTTCFRKEEPGEDWEHHH